MFEILAILSLFAAAILLVALSVIDLKHWILPDKLNLALGISGITFHFSTGYAYVSLADMFIGAAAGAGMLYTIRFFANRYYGQDSLGLGDVKLLGAAGFWLGFEGTILAITLGALAGLVHGLVYALYLSRKNKTKFSVSGLAIPAGPGFAVGIFLMGYLMFYSYVVGVMYVFFS